MSSLPVPVLMLVTDRALAGGADALVAQVTRAVDGGVNAVQVREKDLDDCQLLALALRLRQVTAGRAALLLNGSPELAAAAGADGVHGGEDAPEVAATRRETAGALLIGRSVHAVATAVAAAGADYLVLGTIFPSRSHPGGETGGLARIAVVTAAVRVPVVAIGGITAASIAGVVQAGAAGVAVISAVIGQPDPRAAAAELRAALDRAWAAYLSPGPSPKGGGELWGGDSVEIEAPLPQRTRSGIPRGCHPPALGEGQVWRAD